MANMEQDALKHLTEIVEGRIAMSQQRIADLTAMLEQRLSEDELDKHKQDFNKIEQDPNKIEQDANKIKQDPNKIKQETGEAKQALAKL